MSLNSSFNFQGENMNNSNITKTPTTLSSWQILALTLCAAFAFTLVPDATFAKDVNDVFQDTLCGIAGWFTSGTGKAIATIAVIFLGIAAFFGKVTWGLALMFAVGIFAIFGASEIVNAVAAGHNSGTCK